MPFVSRLKNLGTLSVPELKTTLTVYLLKLEGSEETNLVYTAKDPIATDASPPAHVRFTCPDGQTKRGDILLWASRMKDRAPCVVRGCWVFDGMVWVKPDFNSQFRMEHPEHSGHQLVVQSGPFVKWELKPEPSLSVPDPPTRLGVQVTENSVTPTAMNDSELQRTIRNDPQPNQIAPRNAPRKHCSEARQLYKDNPDIIYANRCRTPSPSSSSHNKRKKSGSPDEPGQNNDNPDPSSLKKRKTIGDPEEQKRNVVNLDSYMKNLEAAALNNRDDSKPSVVLPLPLSCNGASSSQPEASEATPGCIVGRKWVSRSKTVSAVQKPELQSHKTALTVGNTRHSDQVTQLNKDLGDQKLQVVALRASLRASEEGLAAQKTGAGEKQRNLDSTVRKLGRKKQLARRLADEVGAGKQRVEELQHAVAGSADALEAKHRELVSMQADYSNLKDAHSSDIRKLKEELSSCNTALEESRKDSVIKQEAAEHEMGMLRRRTGDLTRDLEAAYAETASVKATSLEEREKFQETLRTTETRLGQDFFKLHKQLTGERGEREQIEKEREALERKTREQIRLIEEAQATCLRLTADSSSERERHVAELSQKQAIHEKRMQSVVQELEEIRAEHATTLLEFTSLREVSQDALVSNADLKRKIKDAITKKEATEHEVGVLRRRTGDLTRDLEAAHAETTSMRAISLSELEKFQEMLLATETRVKQNSFKLREKLAKERGERDRIEKERESLKRENGEQARLLEEAQATCLRLTTDSSSERERHVTELSQKQAIHGERMESLVQELEGIRAKHATTLLDLTALRQVAQDALVSNTDLEQKIKDVAAKLETAEHEMGMLRHRTGDLTRDLEAAHAETTSVKAIALEEREKLLETLRATETCTEQDFEKLREQLAKERGERDRIEMEREALERENKKQSCLLEEAQATRLRLIAHSSSERERHIWELSQKQAIHEERMESLVQELEGIRIKYATTLLDLGTIRQEAQDALVTNEELQQKSKDAQLMLAIRDSEKKSLQEQHAEALGSERWKREDAEKLLDVVRRECQEPFVIPTLLDWFVSAHKEARTLSREK